MRLPKSASEIVISFRRTPHMIFRRSPTGVEPNLLVIRIQPDEGIALTITAKTPGPDVKLATVTMNFHYGEVFGVQSPEATSACCSTRSTATPRSTRAATGSSRRGRS